MLLRPILIFLEFAAALGLFSSRLAPREKLPGRLACAVAAALALCLAYSAAAGAAFAHGGATAQLLTQYGFYCLAFAACYATVYALCDAPVLTALFCATCACAAQNLAAGLEGLLAVAAGSFGLTLSWVAFPLGAMVTSSLAVYALVYRLLVRRINENGLLAVNDRRMLAMAVVVVLAVFAFNIINRSLEQALERGPAETFQIVVLHLIHGLVCAFVLYVSYETLYSRRLQATVDATKQLMAISAKQYRLSAQTISAINQRAHDIRHAIAGQLSREANVSPEVLAQVTRTIDIYDSAVKTGNAALDVILTEKSLLCQNDGIAFSCIADGDAVAALDDVDLYALFGSLLDHAVECAKRFADPSKRTVGLDVREAMGMTVIHVEYPLPACDVPRMDRATVSLVCQRYEGTLSTGTKDGIHTVDVLLSGHQGVLP